MPELAEHIHLCLDLLHICIWFDGNPFDCHLCFVCQLPFEYLHIDCMIHVITIAADLLLGL